MIASPIRIRFPTCRSRPFDFPHVEGLYPRGRFPVTRYATGIVDRLVRGTADEAAHRELMDAVNDFTRTRMREDSFFRRIMPPIPLTNEELDRSDISNLPPAPPDWERQ